MHLYKLSIFSLFLLISHIAISLTGCSKQDDQEQDIVATIGDSYTISFDQLHEYVFDWLYYKMYKDKHEAYNKALDAMVTNQLKRMDFFAKGLEKDKKLIQKIRRIINEELVIEYFNTQYLDKYLTEENARRIYGIMDRQVVYRQIFLKVPENASSKQLASIRKKALEIKIEIDNGKDFNQLVAKYSQDSSSLNSNGFKHPVGWEQSITDPVGEVIFNLKVGDVKVLDVYNGFHIVNITDIKKVDLEPFEKIKSNIITKLKNLYTDKSLEEFEIDKKELIDESRTKWNERALHQLAEWSKIPGFYFEAYKDTLPRAIDRENLTILKYSEEQIDLKEYFRLLNEVLIPNSSENVNEEDLKKFILEALRTDKIVKKAEKLDLDKNILNAQTTNPVLKDNIAYLYNQAVIEAQIPDTTQLNLFKFYEENKDSMYYQLEKINIYVMNFSEKEKADDVIQKIKSGTPFEKISGRWLVKTYVIDRKGYYQTFKSKEQPYLAEAGFKLKLSEVAGPIEYFDPEKGTQFAIIKCVGRRPAKQLSYDDVANIIVNDFKEMNRRKIAEKVERELKRKYNVKFYNDVLAKKLKTS